LIDQCEIIPIDRKTAEIYGRIRAELQRKGKPIPENDIWIAAVAQQHQMTLITNDRHFIDIEKIKLATW